MERDQAHRTNELLERIAKALEKNVKYKVKNNQLVPDTKEIPGFEGVLNDLDNLYQPNDPYNSDYIKARKVILEHAHVPATQALNKELHEQKLHTDDGYQDDDHIHNDYLNDLVQGMNQIEFLQFHSSMNFSFASNDATAMSNAISELEYEECLGAIKTVLFITGDNDYIGAIECSGFNKERKDELARSYIKDRIDGYDNLNTPTSNNPDPAGYGNKDEYEYDLQGIRVDSDHDIRSTAAYYEDEELANGATKKSCILDYVTNEFGSHGARYTDIIKFAYYLGAHNAPKYDNSCRGYYAMAFNTRFGGHLITGGTDQLVKGINKEGKERYYSLCHVDAFTAYWKRLDSYTESRYK